jgi:dihydropteroate synthase
MAPLAASRGCPIVLMHMKGIPADMQDSPCYSDVAGEVYSFLEDRVAKAEAAGMTRDRILVDPGIGFGKRLEDNLDLLRRLGELRSLGCRTVIGYSRKSFLGALTGERNPAARDTAGHAIAALVCDRADIIRVHDVEGTLAVLTAAMALAGKAHR